MGNIKSRKLSILGVAAVAMFGLAACGGGDTAAESTGEMTSEEMTTTEAAPEATESAMEEEMGEDMDPAANLVGPGCEGYAEQVPEGDGSVAGMALDPVATAASNNPILTTLTAAVSGELNPDVDLVDTLNGDEFTVFAPTDDAFAKIDEATLETLGTDADLLSSILTYHVVPGQLSPDEVAGTHTTVNGAELTVEGMGDEITVGEDGSAVVCGGVMTQNATVYMVDTVLMPPSE
ncbi:MULTISPECIES: fasciclin domain-containing protein [unclassified Arthrobacter]|uniref:fasciclin domain-containing protein n=1 Tax=unclassified Arthrobacter TaxID=235627 RepID=UPI0014918F9A|nr:MULTISPECIES: fasciclin domain-containing protein [unclassified Arthrobacter]MBE0011530.1 fasciclin domain-containing protein [Arthrobacter sp. AET 35A]NOJ58728.1 fasciclin domain-containing protein [Arthrobacter sp. 260]